MKNLLELVRDLVKNRYIINKMKKYSAYQITTEGYIRICELAQKNGKKVGDSMQDEFNQILKEHPEWFKFLGVTNKDVDLLTGNLREQGIKIINLKEEQRRKK